MVKLRAAYNGPVRPSRRFSARSIFFGVTIVVVTRPIRRGENPSWLTLPATRGLARPPTRTQLQLLPFQELEWENFERLCYRLAKTRGDVEQWAALYGSR